MTLSSTKNLLGFDISTMSFENIVELILDKINSNQGAHIVTINPEIIELTNTNEEFKKAIEHADLRIPDGVGVVLGFRLKGIKTKRIPGIELSQKLIELAEQKGYKIGLLGSSQEVIEELETRFKNKFPNLQIGFSHNGFFKENKEEKLIETIKSKEIQILFVAMGIPKQEIFINNYKNRLNRTIMIGVGGSFDVWADKVQRAPKAFQNLGLEWFFRLITQPSRFTRMFPTLPMFLLKVIHSISQGDTVKR